MSPPPQRTASAPSRVSRAGDARHLYGAAVGAEINTDNSGVIRYVSLRHGGQVIGANNEINGLTLGGVGSGTTIDHVEVIANLDDAFEIFGGTVNREVPRRHALRR
jgi:hypothetical protein